MVESAGLTRVLRDGTDMHLVRRGSQVVRPGSAKALCVGSIPTLASLSPPPHCAGTTWTRATSGTVMARLTAAAIWSELAPRNLRVSRPLRNSAWGGAGRSATAARTLARTIAWRKSGTGCCVVGAPGLMISAEENGAVLACVDGVGEVVAGFGREEEGRTRVSLRRGVTLVKAPEVRIAGAAMSLLCAGATGGLGERMAHPAISGVTKSSIRRALPDMTSILSSGSCPNQRQANPPRCFLAAC